MYFHNKLLLYCIVLYCIGVSMSIEMSFINNSNNALLKENKAAEIGFIGRE